MYEFSKEYLHKFDNFLGGSNNLVILLNDYKQLLQVLYRGYGFTASELDNDIGIFREHIEKAINSEKLALFPEHQIFIAQVNELDDLFRKISFEDPKDLPDFPWFYRRILKYIDMDGDYAAEYKIDYYKYHELESYRSVYNSIKPIEQIDEELKEERLKVESFEILPWEYFMKNPDIP